MALYVYPPSQVSIPGVATEAKQDVIISELQDIENELQLLNAETTNIYNEAATQTQSLNAIETNSSSIATNTSNTVTELQQIEADIEAGNVLLGTIDADTSNISTKIDQIDADTSNLSAKVDLLEARIAGSLVPETYDYIDLAYVGATTDIQTVTYKTGGALGTTVATLTLAYDGSNRLTSVTRS
jgi:archaellum component FlaC